MLETLAVTLGIESKPNNRGGQWLPVRTMLRLILHAKQTQLLCILRGNQAETFVGCAGTWGVRTRAVTANSGAKVEWVERLILELKGPIGTPQLNS